MEFINGADLGIEQKLDDISDGCRILCLQPKVILAGFAGALHRIFQFLSEEGVVSFEERSGVAHVMDCRPWMAPKRIY